MANHSGRSNRRTKPLTIAALAILAVASLAAAVPPLKAQLTPDQAPATQRPPTPQWQTDAGGKMAFDVASVKQNKSGPPPSGEMPSTSFPLNPGDVYSPTGGLFRGTNLPLVAVIAFAYKLDVTDFLRSQLPKWATVYRVDIAARAAGNPTKDQMRLMMQSLLADRFKMAIHFETREVPVFGLVLDKPGKTGPQLRPHSDDLSCSTAYSPVPLSEVPPSAILAGGFPATCGSIVIMPPSEAGRIHIGARNVSMGFFAKALPTMPNGLDRPVLDRSGLEGTVDLTFEWMPERSGPPGSNVPHDETGTTFLEALKEQLGLKLESQTGPADVLVVDHLEQPSEN
jgi:uncharacterized protein (TIGR03435 family)